MKNILLSSFIFLFFVSSYAFSEISSSSNYVLYYKNSQYDLYWTKGPTYNSFNSCEFARENIYTWAYATRCNSE